MRKAVLVGAALILAVGIGTAYFLILPLILPNEGPEGPEFFPTEQDLPEWTPTLTGELPLKNFANLIKTTALLKSLLQNL